MKQNSYFLLFFLTIILSACNYHNIDDYFEEVDDPDCIVDSVSFSKDVFPIIVDNCSACHNDITQYNDRNYDSYEGIVEVANSELLLKVINHESGYPMMPYEADKLSPCKIKIIEKWIIDGVPNN